MIQQNHAALQIHLQQSCGSALAFAHMHLGVVSRHHYVSSISFFLSCFQIQALGLTALSPEMESLNDVSFKLPLSDLSAKRLQDLNWQWTQRTAMALEQCR